MSESSHSGLGDIWQALRGPLGFIMVLAFLTSVAIGNLEGTFALFSGQHLGVGKAEMGISFAFMGIATVVSMFVGYIKT